MRRTALLALVLASTAALRASDGVARRPALRQRVARAATEDSSEQKVRMFGASLDAGLAGNMAVGPKEIQKVLRMDEAGEDDDEISPDQKADIFYTAAVAALNRGEYDKSTALLNRACFFAGAYTRKGGQMQLWLAQATYAAGERDAAKLLLKKLKAHPDRDVGKVSQELLFILAAPELKLDSSSHLEISVENFKDDRTYQRRADGSLAKRTSTYTPPPKYGSAEWSAAQPRYNGPVDNDPLFALFVIGAFCLGSLFFVRPP